MIKLSRVIPNLAFLKARVSLGGAALAAVAFSAAGTSVIPPPPRPIMVSASAYSAPAYSTPAYAAPGSSALLPAHQAFMVNAGARKGVLHVQWIAAPGYHLYRGTLGMVSTPMPAKGAPATGPVFGKPRITTSRSGGYTVIDIRYPYCSRLASVSNLVLKVQGCHAASPAVCYPPQARATSVPIPAHAC